MKTKTVWNIFGGAEKFAEIGDFPANRDWSIDETGICFQRTPGNFPEEKQIEICRKFFSRCMPSKNMGIDSYGLKHYTERAVNGYITNGACIEAAFEIRFKIWISLESENPNAMIGITRKSAKIALNAIKEEKKVI